MQAYCLQNILEEIVPKAEIEIVDYRSFSTEKKEYLKPVLMSGSQLVRRQFPTAFWTQLGKIQALRSFVKSYCNISNEACRTDDLDTAREFIHDQQYDAIVVGSDTVWCTRQAAYEPLQPNIYALPDVDNIKKIAFAASADGTNEELLHQGDRAKRLANYIADFDFISIRDQYTKNLLTDIGVPRSKINEISDPTLLWDFSELVRDPKLPNDKKIAAVEIGDVKIKEKISAMLSADGYDVLNLLGPTLKHEFSLSPSASVPERLGVYRNADIVITDRFHGSIFTLKTSQTPIIYIEPAEKYPHANSKGRDLYEKFGISEQVWRSDGSFPHDLVEDSINMWDSKIPSIKHGLKELQECSEAHYTTIEQEL